MTLDPDVAALLEQMPPLSADLSVGEMRSLTAGGSLLAGGGDPTTAAWRLRW